MALKIRLSRAGSKKRPVYRVVVADSRSPRDGRFIEKVGLYNPLLQKDNKDRIQLNLESIKEWISRGAKPTDKVARFLGEAGVIPMPAQGNNPKKAQPKKKAQERLAVAEEAKNQPTPEAPVEETPAEESPAEETPSSYTVVNISVTEDTTVTATDAAEEFRYEVSEAGVSDCLLYTSDAADE